MIQVVLDSSACLRTRKWDQVALEYRSRRCWYVFRSLGRVSLVVSETLLLDWVVAMFSPNHVDYATAIWAAHRLGAIISYVTLLAPCH